MHGKWEVTTNYVNDKKLYSVYRLRDVKAVDHSGNRELAIVGHTIKNEQEAEAIAAKLNAVDDEQD